MTRKKVYYCLLLMVILPMIAASQNENGRFIRKVKCEKDSTQEYALFVPAGYSPENNAPLLIFLDPSGKGDVPVNKYHSLADKFGVIMAGSYNSRNFNGASSVGSFVAVYNDLVSQYNIDAGKVWIAGFSGGARAAVAIGITYPEIKGIIGCGAGFASDEGITKESMPAYAAIVGEDDMNYGELLDNSTYLDEKKINNILLSFYGGHQWSPAGNFGLALEWLLAKDSAVSATENGINYLKIANSKFTNGFLYAAWISLHQFDRIPVYKQSADSLMQAIEKRKEFATDKEKFRLVLSEEQNCMNAFSLSFSSMITEKEIGEEKTWIKKVKWISEMIKDSNSYRQLAGRRCFDHCTRTCLEYYFQFLETTDFLSAFNAAQVLSFFTPEDAAPFYYMAKAKAAVGNKKQCEKLLAEAVKKGLPIDKRVLTDDLLLKVLSGEELRKMGSKK